MTTSKKLALASILSAIISTILYIVILFQELDVFEFDYLLLCLLSAQTFLVLTIVFALFLVLSAKGKLNKLKIRKNIITVIAIVLIVCIIFTCYEYITCYYFYSPEDVIANNKEYIQSFFPYHDIDKTEKTHFYIDVSYMTEATFINIDSHGITNSGNSIGYTVKYFKSISPFMIFKFHIEEAVLLPSDLIYVDAFTRTEKLEVDGVEITLFTKDSGGDYGIFISNGNRAIYAELDDSYLNEISAEDFAKTIIEQFVLLEQAAEDKVFLDLSFFDMINEKFG